MSETPRPFYVARVKRVLDVAGSLLLLLVTAPIQALLAVAVAAGDGRPVYFHQTRVGINGQIFRLHKFRTMTVGTDLISGDYPTSAMITKVGRALRRLSLDEIPQLTNILRGEMSFVGPRPALPSQVARYTAEQRGRLVVRPGLTGLAQIRHRNDAPWSRRITADLEYVGRLSLWMDIRILFRTIPVALRGEGQLSGQTAADVDDLDASSPTQVKSAISPPARIRPPTKMPHDLREIGSDFELVESKYLIRAKSPGLPWEDSSGIIYVESGRQALTLVEAELGRQGHTHLHIPSYLCDSMISPFQSRGWTLTELPVDRNLMVHPADLLSRVDMGVLLHTPYFGRRDSPAMLDALDTLRRRGVVVVVDETHRVFSGPSPVADIRVASLRKLLPLYDGGYVAGLSVRPPLRLQTAPSEAMSLRRMAMNAKSAGLVLDDGKQTHLELFARAEHETEIRTQPARMSEHSLSLLRHLDIELIRVAREVNSVSINQALGHSDRFRVINPPTASLLPSHLVLETDDVTGLQAFLIGQRIYCPIHWPPSELLPRTRNWPNHYISVPIDQRYTEFDMKRAAVCIKTYFSGN